jgi:hypothetical protein
MSEALTMNRSDIVRLPPLILHPFAEAGDSMKLMESSKAGMMLEGLLPEADRTRHELDRALLEGRYCELRMLFYVGKDVMRWLEQCSEVAERHPDAFPAGLKRQSFVAYLVDATPRNVVEKLEKWGVAGYQRIFARAVALNAVFNTIPDPPALNEDFIKSYFRYADQIFAVEQREEFPLLDSSRYSMELYASGEYSRMLEREWEG